MSVDVVQLGGACPAGGPCGGKGWSTFVGGLWANNPITIQVLGICSALAVTGRLSNALVMGAALVFVTALSNLLLSLLRRTMPRGLRLVIEMTVISTFVIFFDQVLKAFYPSMSKELGPYVGLIITNCIVMGRAEAFALQNPPLVALVDGAANGMGYAAVLAAIGLVRELLAYGQVLGLTVLPEGWYPRNLLAAQAPGAFIVLGFLVGLFYLLRPRQVEADAAKAGGAP
ncbi:MAG: NADH:ubiquinone reductase (Na(+)-transporting) subunit D [Planctomycetes bacterium]|nr:NADH:ubiquinone reductase (Na(+)-transporting) subunit D [Planctomycetota bacterium]